MDIIITYITDYYIILLILTIILILALIGYISENYFKNKNEIGSEKSMAINNNKPINNQDVIPKEQAVVMNMNTNVINQSVEEVKQEQGINNIVQNKVADNNTPTK